MCRCSQGWVLSLDVSHEYRSLFPGVWQHKGSLAVPVGAFPGRLKRVFLEVPFLPGEISRLQSLLLKFFLSLKCTLKRLLCQDMVNFDRSN